ncbi:MAG TPA: methyltransferase domain-containing protein [Roseiflexaceae bacterium]|nr:methyltransferase domain-containing protein [Roseiflexaceae bacterium]
MTPAWRLPRSHAAELLDADSHDPHALAANLRDLRRTGALLGIGPIVWRALRPFLHGARPTGTVLDVATGGADLPRYLAERAAREGYALRVFASDRQQPILALARTNTDMLRLIRHDARAVPIAAAGVDVITCALALHHFEPPDAIALLCELAQAARQAVIVIDLRRGWPAYAGARLLAVGPWDRMARHDGPLSVRKAYTLRETRALLAATGMCGKAEAVFPFLTLTTLAPG